MPAPAPVFSVLSDGLRLSIRLTPKSSRDAIDGVVALADGQKVLRARVRAVPEKGKANTALIRLLAKTLKLPRSQVTLASGATSRIKTVKLEGDPARLRPGVETMLSRLAQETGS
ncbi:MAG TPA: DUF167 domain-containing protein [Rhizobiales bacterium]|nr:DUF167 domain-containing protein [Hyphomicrobiales bacterium]